MKKSENEVETTTADRKGRPDSISVFELNPCSSINSIVLAGGGSTNPSTIVVSTEAASMGWRRRRRCNKNIVLGGLDDTPKDSIPNKDAFSTPNISREREAPPNDPNATIDIPQSRISSCSNLQTIHSGTFRIAASSSSSSSSSFDTVSSSNIEQKQVSTNNPCANNRSLVSLVLLEGETNDVKGMGHNNNNNNNNSTNRNNAKDELNYPSNVLLHNAQSRLSPSSFSLPSSASTTDRAQVFRRSESPLSLLLSLVLSHDDDGDDSLDVLRISSSSDDELACGARPVLRCSPNPYIFVDDKEPDFDGERKEPELPHNQAPAQHPAANSTTMVPQEVKEASRMSPLTWARFNHERGRIVAKQMMETLQTNRNQAIQEDDDAAFLKEQDAHDGNLNQWHRFKSIFQSSQHHSPVNSSRPSVRSLVASNQNRRVKIRLAGGDSDDRMCLGDGRRRKHRISDLACQAILDDAEFSNYDPRSFPLLCFNTAKRSDSTNNRNGSEPLRNHIVNFSAREAVLRAKEASHGKIIAGTVVGLEDTSSSSGDDEDVAYDNDNDDGHVAFPRSFSLMAEDYDFGAIGQRIASGDNIAALMSDISSDHTFHELDISNHSYDSCFQRLPAEDASALGIAVESRELIAQIRGRAGIVGDFQKRDKPGDACSSTIDDLVPWIHLYGGIWMPHYEVYVARAVHRFRQWLLSPE